MTKTLVILMAFLTIGTTQAQGELKKSKKVDRPPIPMTPLVKSCSKMEGNSPEKKQIE